MVCYRNGKRPKWVPNHSKCWLLSDGLCLLRIGGGLLLDSLGLVRIDKFKGKAPLFELFNFAKKDTHFHHKKCNNQTNITPEQVDTIMQQVKPASTASRDL